MDSGDASDEEAPPCDLKSNNLMQKGELKVISMLVAMESEDGLRRGAIMVIAQKIGFAHAEQAKSVHQLSIINSPEFCLLKENSLRTP